MYNTVAIRELLIAAFNDEELKTFCFDHFGPVYEQFTTGMTKGQMVQLLLDHCNRHMELPSLLNLVQQARPVLYAAYVDRIYQPGDDRAYGIGATFQGILLAEVLAIMSLILAIRTSSSAGLVPLTASYDMAILYAVGFALTYGLVCFFVTRRWLRYPVPVCVAALLGGPVLLLVMWMLVRLIPR